MTKRDEVAIEYFASRAYQVESVELESACGGVDPSCYGDRGARTWQDDDVARTEMDSNMADGIMSDVAQGEGCDLFGPCNDDVPEPEFRSSVVQDEWERAQNRFPW